MNQAGAMARGRVVALVGPDNTDSVRELVTDSDDVFIELAHLYQRAKEERLDVILVDDSRRDLSRAVATRIRRNHALTELWRLSTDPHPELDLPEYFDGAIATELGTEAVRDKINSILASQELLRRQSIVGRSPRMKMVAQTIGRVAPTEMSVLIVGPSGSGKELVAQAIHDGSLRAERPSVAVNCGALAEGVLESELFGHAKGAFTGSVGKREGLFHRADGGTIFLDEIGDTSPQMQVKLLRVLEDGTYYPVGSSTPRKADVRLISATNRDLTEAIAEGEFREDLYFRIAVVRIEVPPLLDRKEDIQPLLHHFWRNCPKLSYSDSALQRLMDYDWPGNVRQLRNFTDRMVALVGTGVVEVADVDQFLDEQRQSTTHLPVSTGKTVEEAGQELIYRAIMQLGNEIRMLRDLIISNLPDKDGITMPEDQAESRMAEFDVTSMDQMEKELIRRTLARYRGNRKETANNLGIGERTLYRKLKKYNLS
ncbi:MAG: sigma-54 dependent transcriptional regulator [bacterium]